MNGKKMFERRLPWALWTATLVGLIGIFVMFVTGVPREQLVEPTVIAAFFFVLSFATTGALISNRHPTNAVGWLCSCAALVVVAAGLADSFVNSFPLQAADGGPGIRFLVALGQSLWVPGLGLGATFVLLLFPDGHVPSERWRWVARLAGAALTLVTLSFLLMPGNIQDYPVINPIGITGASGLLEGLGSIGLIGFVLTFVLSLTSVVFRFRAAPSVQRQQLKWLIFAGMSIAMVLVLSFVIEAVGDSETSDEISNFFITTALSLVPLGIGVGILKYRLYDIDLVVNRALVYGSLTVALGAAYVGLVVGFQALLAPLAAESDLAVAGSTLAVAALFRPARSRIQGFIDRRFYRRKFDAERAAAEFSERLRDQVDLTSITLQLTEAIRETVQPTQVSVWLRTETLRVERG